MEFKKSFSHVVYFGREDIYNDEHHPTDSLRRSEDVLHGLRSGDDPGDSLFPKKSTLSISIGLPKSSCTALGREERWSLLC